MSLAVYLLTYLCIRTVPRRPRDGRCCISYYTAPSVITDYMPARAECPISLSISPVLAPDYNGIITSGTFSACLISTALPPAADVLPVRPSPVRARPSLIRIKYLARDLPRQSSEVMGDPPHTNTDDHNLIYCLPDRREIACYSIACSLPNELHRICCEYLTGQLTTTDVPFDSELVTEILHSDAPWQPSITIPAAPSELLPLPFVPPVNPTIQSDSTSEPNTNSSSSLPVPHQDGVAHHLATDARTLPSPIESDLSFRSRT